MESLGGKLVRETVWSILAKTLSFACLLSINVILARTLGDYGFGQWAFYFSVFTILLVLANLGIDHSARTHVACANETAEVARAAADGLFLRVLVSAICALAISAVGPLLGDAFRKPYLGTLLRWSGPLLFFSGMLEHYKNAFMGAHRLKYACIVISLEWSLKLVGVVACVIWALSLDAVLLAYSVATCVAAAVGALILVNFFFRRQAMSSRSYLSDIAHYSVPLFFLGMGYLAVAEINTLMLGLLSDARQVGYFAVGRDIATKVPQFALALVMGSGPIFAGALRENRRKMQAVMLRLVTISLAVTGGAAVGVLILSPWVVPLLYGRSYFPAVLPLQILSVHMLCLSLSVIASTFLDYQKLAGVRARNLALSAVCNVSLNLLLIPRYGAVGAAVGMTLGYIPYVVMNYVEVWGTLFSECSSASES